MLRRTCLGLIAGLFLAVPSFADPVDDLVKVLKLPQLFEVLRAEGLGYGAELEADLFPGAGGARWKERVEAIHDAGRMTVLAEQELRRSLGAETGSVKRMLAFFGSEGGQRIIELELAARRAFLDAGLREAAEERFHRLERDHAPRLGQIRALVEINDLIEQNVAGGLNASLAFYRGMLAGGGIDGSLPEDEMMADLWAQEPAIREETLAWVFPYLTLAYQPLSDAELQGYIDFSAGPEGQQLNTALFSAFEVVFGGVSEALGRSAAEFLISEDI